MQQALGPDPMQKFQRKLDALIYLKSPFKNLVLNDYDVVDFFYQNLSIVALMKVPKFGKGKAAEKREYVWP